MKETDIKAWGKEIVKLGAAVAVRVTPYDCDSVWLCVEVERECEREGGERDDGDWGQIPSHWIYSNGFLDLVH